MAENDHPKVFISYSWTSEAYKDRVLKLAERLVNDGVDVIFDRWDLRPGQDMYAFMEQSIRDAEKVLILCEEGYAQKADNRTGGVGTETQIITPDVYGKHRQEKFIPIVMEIPKAVPSYLKSRYALYITKDEETEYRTLCRTIFGVSERKKPSLGKRPMWLEAEPSANKDKPADSGLVKPDLGIAANGDRIKPELGEKPEWLEDRGKKSHEVTAEHEKAFNGSTDVKEDASDSRMFERVRTIVSKISKGERISDRGSVSTKKPSGTSTTASGKQPVTKAPESQRHLILHKGDRYEFGHYPKERDGKDEPLLWRVLDVDAEKGRALLITENLIDCQKYHGEGKEITWEECDLRKWLNGEFIGGAFDKGDLGKIAEMSIQNLDNTDYVMKGGRATTDKVFALSIEEAEKYFSDDMDRRAAVTPYARSHGSHSIKDFTTPAGQLAGCWWLRSPGLFSFLASYVTTDGGVYRVGGHVLDDGVSVRPALWLNL